MNRNFENRKPTKVYAKSNENQMIIKALNMYGRVPETWELLEEIEKLNNIINDLLKRQNEALNYISNFLSMDNRYKHGNGNDELELVRRILNKHNQEPKGSDSNVKD